MEVFLPENLTDCDKVKEAERCRELVPLDVFINGRECTNQQAW
jgi:hypothetical protein